VKIKGLGWFDNLEREKNKLVKADAYFYQTNLERLTGILTNILQDKDVVI